MSLKQILLTTLLPLAALAKTDIDGCTSFTSMVTVRPEPGYGNTYASVIWYVPDSLEICEGVDCGGGRAPPKSVPGCPLYEGTETVTAKFLDADPMAQTAVKTTEAPQETGVEEGGDEDTGDEPVEEEETTSSTEEAVTTTTIATTTSASSENASATFTPSSSETETEVETETQTQTQTQTETVSEETGTSTQAGSDEATTTGPENVETGAAVALGANGLIGAAALAFALL